MAFEEGRKVCDRMQEDQGGIYSIRGTARRRVFLKATTRVMCACVVSLCVCVSVLRFVARLCLLRLCDDGSL